MPAEVFPNVGLQFLHDWFPRQAITAPATLYVGLFTNFTATTVASMDAGIGSIVEPGAGGYTRMAVPAASWLGAASIAGGVIATGAQVSFPETTAAYTPTHAVNGYFLTDKASGSAALIAMSNFSTDAAIIVNQAGIVVRVTPAWKKTW
jgi:hypothetical protein